MHVKLVSFITDHSKAAVLVLLSVACFGVRVSVTFHLIVCSYYFSSVLLALAHSVDHMFSLSFDYLLF